MEERLKQLLNSAIRSKLSEGIQQVAAYSIYPAEICTTELTSAQALMAGLFYCLQHRDPMAVVLVSVSSCVPQIQSSFVKVWLRDDFCFHRLDVAKCLSYLAQIAVQEGTSMRSPIVSAMTGLEKKYGLSGYFSQTLVQCAEQGVLQKQILQRKTSQEKFGDTWSSAMESLSTQPFPEDQVTEDLTADTWSFLDVPVPEEEAIEALSLETQRLNFERNLDNHSICDFYVTTISAEVHIIDQDKESTPLELEMDTVHILSGMDNQEAQDMLWTAAYTNNTMNASKALAAGARPSCSNKWGDTPLHLATSRGNCHVASVLISGGAMVNCRTDLDSTPLHYAANYGQLECAVLLLRHGADRKAKDNKGNTPYQVALKNGHYSLADHLRF